MPTLLPVERVLDLKQPGGVPPADHPTTTEVDRSTARGVAEPPHREVSRPGALAVPSTGGAAQGSPDGAESQVEVPPGERVRLVTEPTTTVVVWRGEGKGGLFAPSRIRRIEHARDALNRTEQLVYDVLWGQSTETDDYRLAQVGYSRIAKEAGITKRTAALVTRRLRGKGILSQERPPDAWRATEYRILGYRAALDNLQQHGREWVVRSGNGVLFVHPVTEVDESSIAVVADPTPVMVCPPVAGVAEPPTTGVDDLSTALLNHPEGRQSISPPGPGATGSQNPAGCRPSASGSSAVVDGSRAPVSAAAPRAGSIAELVAGAYRPVTEHELAELRGMLWGDSDDEKLATELKRVIKKGGAAPELHLGFLARMIESADWTICDVFGFRPWRTPGRADGHRA